MKQGFVIVLLLCISASMGMAQETGMDVTDDSLRTQAADTVLLKSYAARYDPRKALLYAAIVPGLGQIYNKKYWKLPLVYGGFAAVTWNINRYNKYYKQYK